MSGGVSQAASSEGGTVCAAEEAIECVPPTVACKESPAAETQTSSKAEGPHSSPAVDDKAKAKVGGTASLASEAEAVVSGQTSKEEQDSDTQKGTSVSDDVAEETSRVCSAWNGEEGRTVSAWLRREGLVGIHELLVEALLTPTPKTNAGSRLASLASRAAQLPAVPGVVYDPHHYQFLARYFETPTSTSPTTKRFPLRRWGFLKSFKFACDAVLGAHKPGDFSDSEVQPVDETVARDMGRGEPSLVESYVLAEHPHLVLPVVKGVSRDKKSRRWAVYYRGQRHYFYDKNAGGCRRAYKLAVGLRRQQVEEVELLQSFEEIVAGQQRAAAAECRPCPGPCMRAVVGALLFDLMQFLEDKGQKQLGLEAGAVATLVAMVKAHAAAVKTAVGAAPVIDHIAVLRKCISDQLMPSQLPSSQVLLLLQQLLVLQLHSACDLLVQTGLWRCIVAHAKGQLQGVGVALSSAPPPQDDGTNSASGQGTLRGQDCIPEVKANSQQQGTPVTLTSDQQQQQQQKEDQQQEEQEQTESISLQPKCVSAPRPLSAESIKDLPTVSFQAGADGGGGAVSGDGASDATLSGAVPVAESASPMAVDT